MGLLSDPSLTPQNKIGKLLASHHTKLSWICYLASIIWFTCLAYNDFNHTTYLSENALSPGLVYPEITQHSSHLLQHFLNELEREREQHKTTTPYTWIKSKMHQIGLETYIHNYTLTFPFGEGKVYSGKNIYGILRAPRTGSTEGVIFSSPYRPPSSIHADITASIPVLLTFAEFARKKNYWAKDLIFLVTEHEQLGIHAFLEAYFSASNKQKNHYLNYGHLPARVGALQAALNLEIQDLDIDYIDVKIEGLNGQLPNLDLFNVVQRIASREGISSGYKQMPLRKRRLYKSSLENNLKFMLSMLLSQASGVPNGNHGHYHCHRIEALTLEGVRRQVHVNLNNRHNDGLPLLRIIEGISRSLNNLLERFHQSYFFYILVQNDRFISIGNYMPCLGWLILPLFAKGYLLWLLANGDEFKEVKNDENDNSDDEHAKINLIIKKQHQYKSSTNITPAITFILCAGLVGVMCRYPACIDIPIKYLVKCNFKTSTSVTIITGFWSIIICLMPFLYKFSTTPLYWLHFICLMGLATTLTVLGLLNFALAYLIAVVVVPLALTVNITDNKIAKRTFSIIVCLLLHPFNFVLLGVFILTILQFPELPLKYLILRAFDAAKDGITFSLTDDLIYNNWLYTMVTCILLPLWCGYWTLIVCQPNQLSEKHSYTIKTGKKIN